MNCSLFSQNRTLVLLALTIPASFLVGCGGTDHTIQVKGREGMSLGNGKYLFPDGNGGLKAGKLRNENGQPPPGVLVINPKSEDEVRDWLTRNGVNIDKPIPQETKVK